MSEELKPCPFCGCEVGLVTGDEYFTVRGDHSLSCVFLDDEPIASADEWNIRAELTAIKGGGEVVAATIGFYAGEREPRLLSWNVLPDGEHHLYTHPPVVAEAEPVEVVGYGFRHVDKGWLFSRQSYHEVNPCLEGFRLMTVAQHQRIVATLNATHTPTPQQISDYLNGLEAIQREVAERDARQAAPPASGAVPVSDGWLRVIDNELVCCHIGTASPNDSYEDASAKLVSLIGWHVQVATDSAVNGGDLLVPRELLGRVLDPETGEEWSKACKELRALLAKGVV